MFEQRPEVTRPDDSARWTSPFTGMAKAADLPDITLPGGPKGFALAVEMREPEIVSHPEPGPGRTCLWVRRRDGEAITPAVAAYLADMVPMSICRALGVIALGTSLDNTIRIGSFEETEWLLIDLRPHLALGGYGHGAAHVWSESGHLLAPPPARRPRPRAGGRRGAPAFFASLVAEPQTAVPTHRTGQQNPVMVYRYVCANTIEEKVMELKARKADLFNSVMDAEGALSGALSETDIRGRLDLS